MEPEPSEFVLLTLGISPKNHNIAMSDYNLFQSQVYALHMTHTYTHTHTQNK